MLQKNLDLLHGPVLPALTRLALPIMGTSFVQMAYNMTDMLWIGRLGSDAVAAVGASGMYMWLAGGVAVMPRMGGQVKTGHAMGAGQTGEAAVYARTALQMGILAGLLYGIIALLFSGPLIGFFSLHSSRIVADAQSYLQITCGLVVFSFINQVLTGITTAMGNSRISFLATSTGLVANIILDPVLIFGIGPFPELRVAGAAIATVTAQAIVTVVFLAYVLREPSLFRHIRILERPDLAHIREIVQIGLPSALQNMAFTGISMILTRLVATFGDAAVAVQRVGSQIENISWVTAEGFGAAVNAFLAQNLGAGKKDRIRKGYRAALAAIFVWGLFCTFLLMVLPAPVFRLFIQEEELLPMGVNYLWILGISQLFMCVELTTAGAFSGLGKTVPPSVVSIVFTAARIPLAFLLSSTVLGLNGVWWSVSLSSVVKGVVLCSWFLFYLKKRL